MKTITINNFFKSIVYYLLLLTGLISTSWIIWSRFIRTRIIREIPDYLLTEYRFWILLYICFIYLFVVKDLIKPSNANPVFKYVGDIISLPLITFDHAIKYNYIIKPYYYKFIFKFVTFTEKISYFHIQVFLFFMQVFPRIILVTFLVLDTFYFQRLELFYKVVLIGLFPFILRYIKYSLKDIYEHWILTLEHIYQRVRIYEEGYEFDEDRINNTKAIFHNQKKTIKEYIEIKFNNFFEYLGDKVEYQYNSMPFMKEKSYDEYLLNKYNTKKKIPTAEDLDIMDALYYELMPNIINMKIFIAHFEFVGESKVIKWSKIIIFSLYFICWFYILIISYAFYPVELSMGKDLLLYFMIHLCDSENPFDGYDTVF